MNQSGRRPSLLIRALTRAVPLIEGFVHYRDPAYLALKRLTAAAGSLITIADRETGVNVVTPVESYHMFGETWYTRDYDVPACPIRRGDAVIDIGAHHGFFTCYAAAQGASVHAFEPSPESYERLLANLERNGFEKQVHTEAAAVSNTSGLIALRCFDYLGGGSNTIVPTHVPDWTPTATIEVPAVDINTVLARVGTRVRICKMDCEGAELEILRALRDPSQVDAFALEFHPRAYALSDLVRVIDSWQTHHITFARRSFMLYAVATHALADHAGTY